MTQGKSIEHAFRRPGTKSSDPSWSGTDSSVLLDVFLLGFLVEETPSEHGENMQAPHRKAREIAHMSTGGLGRTYPTSTYKNLQASKLLFLAN